MSSAGPTQGAGTHLVRQDGGLQGGETAATLGKVGEPGGPAREELEPESWRSRVSDGGSARTATWDCRWRRVDVCVT